MKKYRFKKKWVCFFIRIFDIFCSFASKKKAINPSCIKKIVVIRIDHIGDAILSSFLFKYLKNFYNKPHITVICNPTNINVFEENPYIDNIISFKHHWFSSERISLKEILKLIKILRKEKFDLGLDLRGDIRNILLLKIGKVKYIAGFPEGGGGNLLDICCDNTFEYHQSIRIKKLLEELGIKKTIILKGEIYYNNYHQQKVEKFLQQIKNKYCVLHPSSRTQAKQWPMKHWEKVISYLLSKGYTILITGTNSEKNVENLFKTYSSLIDIRSKFSLNELYLLLKNAEFFIGNDSGPAHIAGITDIPTIVIFSGTNIASQWKPLGNKVYTIQKKTECSPCEGEICTRKDHLCMNSIQPEEVIKILKNIIS